MKDMSKELNSPIIVANGEINVHRVDDKTLSVDFEVNDENGNAMTDENGNPSRQVAWPDGTVTDYDPAQLDSYMNTLDTSNTQDGQGDSSNPSNEMDGNNNEQNSSVNTLDDFKIKTGSDSSVPMQ